jgi:PAS domain S-box-containing protein
LEDDFSDAELIRELLEAERLPCEITRVQTRPEFAAALERGGFDLILADNSLPAFDGLSALRLAQTERPDVPFIFVSGTLGEELAIEALKIGATDYVLKQRLSRLVPSIQRALSEAQGRVARKQAEEALRRSEAHLAQAQRLSRTGSFHWNLATGKTFWSEETYRILGYDTTTEPTRDLVMQRVHPDDAALVREAFVATSERRQPVDFEYRMLMPDGAIKHVRVVGRPAGGEGSDHHILGTIMDITVHKEAYAALQQSEQRYKHLFHHMPIALWQQDARNLAQLFRQLRQDGVTDLAPHLDANPDFLATCMEALITEEVNARTAQLLGRGDPSEFSGRSVAYCWQARPDTFRRALESRFRGEVYFEEETKLTTLDGRAVDVLFTTSRIGANGDLGMSLVGVVDISQRVRAQEMLSRVQADFAHAARVSVLGEFTASIAHEINQPLAAIAANGAAGLRWLGQTEPDLSELRELIESIVADAQRTADIIARIRAMAARRAPAQSLVSLDDVIREALLFLRHELQARAVTVWHYAAPADALVLGDRTQLQQVIVNLVVNSMQAISQVTAGKRIVTVRTVMPESTIVRCTVDDSGPGIAPEHFEQLFESFFTTKQGGIGMGLPICRSIIEAHGGSITADNRSPEGGARFIFALPAARKTQLAGDGSG